MAQRVSYLVLAWAALGITAACGGSTASQSGGGGSPTGGSGSESTGAQAGSGGTTPMDLSILSSNGFIYQVTDVWQGSDPPPQFRSDELSASDYETVTDGEVFQVTFPNAAAEIELQSQNTGDTASGQRTVQTEDRVEYELDASLSRFVIWAEDGPDPGIDLPAEHTIYGSGVPIMASTRGQLWLTQP